MKRLTEFCLRSQLKVLKLLSYLRDLAKRIAVTVSHLYFRLDNLLQNLRQSSGGDFGMLDRAPGGPTSMMQSGITQAREIDDPPGLHEKTEYLLREWVNMYHSPAAGRDSTKAFSAFVQQVYTFLYSKRFRRVILNWRCRYILLTFLGLFEKVLSSLLWIEGNMNISIFLSLSFCSVCLSCFNSFTYNTGSLTSYSCRVASTEYQYIYYLLALTLFRKFLHNLMKNVLETWFWKQNKLICWKKYLGSQF